MTRIQRVKAALQAFTIGALALLAGCASPPPRPTSLARGDYDAVRQHLDKLIADEMRRHGVTGLSIALVDDQQVVWAFGAGWADEQARRPADEHTVYRMGSISKLFTDTAAMQLVQRGQLDLDAPLQTSLPDFHIRSRFGSAPITARQLMTHHAGLPRDIGYAMWGLSGDMPPPFQQMVSGLADEDAPYPPGLQFDYSNVGVTVLGAAIERISGQRFQALLQQALLGPLGMTTASFSSALPAIPPTSKAYRKGRLVPEPALRDVPAGGLNASVLDIAQFIKMVFAEGRAGGPGEGQILDPALLREMLRPQNADVPLDAGFHVGLGWMLSTLGGEPLEGGGLVAHHAGATVNFRSQMVLLPQHRLGVVVASNSAGAGPVVNKLAQRALALALEAKTGIRQPEPAPPRPPTPAAWPEAELQALVGDYTTAAGFVRVTRHGSALQAEVAGRTVQLVPIEGGELRLRYKLLGLMPIGLGELDRLTLRPQRVAGRDVLLARIGMQTMRVGERLPAATLPPALAALTGTFVPETAPGEYALVTQARVRVEHGRLLARMTMRDEPEAPIQFVLQPLSDREAVVLGTLADGGEVIRLDQEGAQPTLRSSGYRWRRVGEERR